jgi:hypothetical protein
MIDTEELNRRLVAVGEQVKAKGWPSASINIHISYLGIYDLEPRPYDPMISYYSDIHASSPGKYGAPTSHKFIKDADNIKTIEEAVTKLEECAAEMPTMEDECSRIEAAKGKLTADERRLLGIY